MLCNVVVCHRCWVHVPMIHAAGHFDHTKRVAWVPISMHTCGSFFYNYGALLNRPFYSCMLSCLAINASEAGVDLALIQTSMLFSCKYELVSIRTT